MPKLRNKELLPFGLVEKHKPGYISSLALKCKVSADSILQNKFDLKCHLFVPQHDIMQYFIQWQRYRKYWWSSITTTPSLLTLNDIKYEKNIADVDIIARFPWGPITVETVKATLKQKDSDNASHVCCSMSIEGALMIILLDAMTNNMKEEYLRLHRTMAPFKISFALEFKDPKQKQNLTELATLLHLRLQSKKISSLLPDFTVSLDTQIQENAQIGVVYTAILSENTLNNGMFHLLNSSTTLKEQIHVADFDDYAAHLFGKV